MQAVTKRDGSPCGTGLTEVDVPLIAWYFPPILLTNPQVQSTYRVGMKSNRATLIRVSRDSLPPRISRFLFPARTSLAFPFFLRGRFLGAP